MTDGKVSLKLQVNHMEEQKLILMWHVATKLMCSKYFANSNLIVDTIVKTEQSGVSTIVSI